MLNGSWRKLHNGYLQNLYSERIITAIKPRSIRLTAHVARTLERNIACRVLVKQRDHYILKGSDDGV
jgi:hypothetical protein